MNQAKRRIRRRRSPKSKSARVILSILAVLFVFLIAYSIGSFISNLISSPAKESTEATDNTQIIKLQNACTALTQEKKDLEIKLETAKEDRDYYKSLCEEYEKRFGELADFQYSKPYSASESPQTTDAFASESTPPGA